MNNIEILSEDQILTMKNNQKHIKEFILNHEDNTWLADFFNEANPFKNSKIQMKDIELKFTNDKNEMIQDDLVNAIKLYESLNITDSQAIDERLWVGLCFGKFYKYMRNRWYPYNDTFLPEHWYCPHGQKRGLYFNGLARLFWAVKITYDETLEDKYELTRFCFNTDFNIITQTIYRSFANSKVVRLSLFKSLKQHIENGGMYNRNILRGILKYISFLGGAYILDYFTQDELMKKILNKLKELESIEKQ